MVSTGPSSGPIAHMDIATPLFAGSVTSAIMPPPIVIGAEQAHPARKRNTKNMAVFVLKAQPMVNARKMTFATWIMIIRPYTSDRGAMVRGPKAKPSM